MKHFNDENNNLFAFESDGSQDEFIPAGLIAITPAAAEAIRNPTKSLADLKVSKKIEISEIFTQSMQQITAGYPPDEISSWGKQENEAIAFNANATAPTPLIDALSAARGVIKAELVTRIINKANLFATVSGQLIGKRQGLEDAIDAATTKTSLTEIVW